MPIEDRVIDTFLIPTGARLKLVDNGDESRSISVAIASSERLSAISEISSLPREYFDMFGHLRVSNPQMLLKSSYIHDAEPDIWDDQQVSGGGTTSAHDATRACVTLGVTALTAGERRRQMFRGATYQPGKSQLVEITGTMGAHIPGVIKEYCLGDELNGLGWSSDGTDIAPFIRSGVSGVTTTTRIPRSTWTHDKLDGAGASGITFNPLAAQIFWVAFEWLGVGDVFFGMIIGAQYILCHHLKHANVFTGGGAYIANPNLPPMCRIIADGSNTQGASMTQVCCAVISEGGQDEAGIDCAISRGASPMITNNDANWYPLFAFRPRARGISIVIEHLEVVNTTASVFEIGVFLNPTVTGTQLSFSQYRTLPLDVDVSRTNATIISGGVLMHNSVSQETASTGNTFSEQLNRARIRAGFSIAGIADIIVIAVRRLSGGAETFYSSVCLRLI